MKSFVGLVVCLFAVACSSPEGSDPNASSSDNALESSGEKKMTHKGGSVCSGWACANGSQPVSDDALFDLIAGHQDSGTSAPATGGGASSSGSAPTVYVELSAIECVSITDACVRSCAIRTPCGGGGYVSEQESSILFDWIHQHGARDSGPSWATRSATGDVVCSKPVAPGAHASCWLSTPVPPTP